MRPLSGPSSDRCALAAVTLSIERRGKPLAIEVKVK